MAVQPKKYADLKPFLVWWYRHFDAASVRTPKKLVRSLEGVTQDELGRWADYLTAFRRLRQDARERVCARFLKEQ